MVAFLCLGSNQGDRQANLGQALAHLGRRLSIRRISSVYDSEALDRVNQPDFLNLVCQVETELEPESLLELCLQVEEKMGRIRTVSKGPRNIDIDLLFTGDQIIESPRLSVPHPAIYRRRFALTGLEEIAPDFRDPASGKTVRDLLEQCRDSSRVTLYH